MNWTIIHAIFRRDFVSYFSNPTGYVFICVFVMLSSLAAFWPPEFFANNLANLDQLSTWMPFILLVFVPAITMSTWAEERRQGTDELLLTLPSTDVDVVLGKYLAAVAIFTVALLFSMVSVLLVFLYGLGEPDLGLYVGAYLGYWFVGLAMLSIGMVASFLTSNLTVGFILGMLFNAPLAIAGVADWVVKDPAMAQAVRRWSALEQFADFQRGVFTLSGAVYFLSIAAVMLYVSMILIGRRHWTGGADGASRGGHFLTRVVALLLVAGAANYALSNLGWGRADLSVEQLNSLSPKTKEMVRKLADDKDVRPIRVTAYVSPQVPSELAAQKRDLLATLRELQSISGGKVQVDVNQIETFSEEATYAERNFGIEARDVETTQRGARTREEVFLGAAFECGLDKVVIPFFDRGIPVEYEVVRSIATVAQQKRKRVGVVKTAASLLGGFNMQSMGQNEESQLVTELKKQYDVVEVDPAGPIADDYDVLLAVQPSSLRPEQLDNFVAAVKAGIPTAIFEDPYPVTDFAATTVGTAQDNRPAGGPMAMFGGGQAEPKGDISQLWRLLGVRFDGQQLVWQEYNPYPGAEAFTTPDWVYVDQDNGAEEPFNPANMISNGMKQVLFLFAGSVAPAPGSKLDFQPLAVTNEARSGVMSYQEAEMAARSPNMARRSPPTRTTSYVIAAEISGKPPEEDSLSADEVNTGELSEEDLKEEKPAGADSKEKEPATPPIKAVVVADIDCLSNIFFMIRALGDQEGSPVDWRFQNTTFVLNILDSLANDERFVDIRKRTREHRTLTLIEDATYEARKEALTERSEFSKEAEEQIELAQQKFREAIDEIRNRPGLSAQQKAVLVDQEQARRQRMLDVETNRLRQSAQRKTRQIERDLTAEVRGVQDFFKFTAVILPPILPILLAAIVFFHRRQAEQEGVAKERLRFHTAEQEPVVKKD
ncbi:ABC-type uncharacterized transport system [Pirellulimonas nuda]|uniref:ABC-type uncharacterized transport system n=1 Tax=Pirellulimonas nuda TaxID=2528009 RepID=A0A518DJR0_9BACT|nr:Gldg family protein [Pirellulimonas nuda]QDU91686.1 ABC-type uncharacterized transport system [Pirellulimonas nuda]